MNGLERNLSRFLSNNREIGQIDFWFENAGRGFHISPAGFRRVATAIRSGRIHARNVGATDDWGSYDWCPNDIGMSFDEIPDTTNDKAGVIHEAVHALLDLSNCASTTWLSDEAAAYLAEVIYSYSKHRSRDWVSLSTTPRAILDAALALATGSGIINEARQTIRRGVRLSWAQYANLRTAVSVNGYSYLGALERVPCPGVP